MSRIATSLPPTGAESTSRKPREAVALTEMTADLTVQPASDCTSPPLPYRYHKASSPKFLLHAASMDGMQPVVTFRGAYYQHTCSTATKSASHLLLGDVGETEVKANLEVTEDKLVLKGYFLNQPPWNSTLGIWEVYYNLNGSPMKLAVHKKNTNTARAWAN